MGADYSPDLFYGFKLKDIRIWIFEFAVSRLSEDGDHYVFGVNVRFKNFKRGKISDDAKRFGNLIKKYFGIKCGYHMVQSADAAAYGHHKQRDTPCISFLSWMRLVKPEWSVEECKRVQMEITEFDEDDEDEYDDETWAMERIKKWGLKWPFHIEESDSESADEEETENAKKKSKEGPRVD